MSKWSNCWIAARIEYERRCWRWRRDPVNNPVPYLIRRPSFAARMIDHHGVGRLDESIDAVRPSSFKPDDNMPQTLRWWQLPIVLLFPGRWVSGDAEGAAKHRDWWITDHGELGD